MSKKLKLVADHKIPFVSEFFDKHCDITRLPGEAITAADIKNAQVLITRTVTPVNAALLTNIAVQFVGSATTGSDHIDQAWLAEKQITLATAAGANATAVANYVLCCVAALREQGLLQNPKPIAGIIGCGRIGSIVASQLQSLGFEICCYDPLLIEKPSFTFIELKTLLQQADFITLHTPLTTTGPYPTYHMLDAKHLALCKPTAILCNTARGSVIDQQALLDHPSLMHCLDVWENEPCIDQALLNKATLATPHIAGYSLEGKFRATEIIYQQAAQFFGWNTHTTVSPFTKGGLKRGSSISSQSTWEAAVLSAYNPMTHTQHFRKALQSPEAIKEKFITERQQYVLRHEFSYYALAASLQNCNEKLFHTLRGLGFGVAT